MQVMQVLVQSPQACGQACGHHHTQGATQGEGSASGRGAGAGRKLLHHAGPRIPCNRPEMTKKQTRMRFICAISFFSLKYA